MPYFQIGQHARNLIVLENIIVYIKSLKKGFNFSNLETKLEMSITLHKGTDVYVIVLSNIDALHDYLVPFLLSMNFQSRKSVDFFLLMFNYLFTQIWLFLSTRR